VAFCGRLTHDATHSWASRCEYRDNLKSGRLPPSVVHCAASSLMCNMGKVLDVRRSVSFPSPSTIEVIAAGGLNAANEAPCTSSMVTCVQFCIEGHFSDVELRLIISGEKDIFQVDGTWIRSFCSCLRLPVNDFVMERPVS
jgi:hypothetical protein